MIPESFLGKPIKIKVSGYKIPITLNPNRGELDVTAPFHRGLINEIKSMEGAKWHGFDDKNPRKVWSISNTARNWFQLRYLMGENPYEVYDRDLVSVTSNRPLYKHQLKQKSFIWTRHYCVLGAEMGTGKSLSAIEVAEETGYKDSEILYVGPKSGVEAFGRELRKWSSKVNPKRITYDALVSLVGKWPSGHPAPKFLILDESSKVKTHTAQRSKAAKWMADAVRVEHGQNGFVIEMTGTPSPRSPEDWWNQCEIACPGYLKEGSIAKFKARLCLIKNQASLSGGSFPKLITWFDDENKCKVCGQFLLANVHDASMMLPDFHEFQKSTNEVAYLYERLKGLVLIQFKKDCVDLPEITYDVIQCTPPADMIRASKMIRTRCRRAITALTLLRELSDGFQYEVTGSGEKTICKSCGGTGKSMAPKMDAVAPWEQFQPQDEITLAEIECPVCGGEGQTEIEIRNPVNVPTPKDEAFIDQLDEMEDCGRALVWASFTATIDKLDALARKYGWATLTIDARGFIGKTPFGVSLDKEDCLSAMDRSHPKYDELLEKIPKLVVIGQPQSGGMALTFTAAPVNIFYSNVFEGEARMQAIHRFHRLGMDTERGAIVRDILCLPSDKLVRDNLQNKERLQRITMGDIEKEFKDASCD